MSGFTESYKEFDKSEKKVKTVPFSKNPIRRQIEWNLILFRNNDLSINNTVNNIIEEIERHLNLLKEKS